MTKKERAKLRRQRRNRRIALIVAAVVLVAVFAIGGTVAWLTDATGDVENTFTAGDIDIDLKETTEDYKMVPGTDIAKDPKVTVEANSEACWLFVEVTESDNLDNFITYTIADGWSNGDGTNIPGNVWYRTVETSDTVQSWYLLAGDGKSGEEATDYSNGMVTVKDTVTKQMLNALTDDTRPTLTFTAYACQKAKFDTPAAAWDIAKTATPPAAAE